jgi:hypothetical protein
MARRNQAIIAACAAMMAFILDERKCGMNRQYPKFQEWLAMREGLWLADKNAVVGMSRIDPLSATQSTPKPPVQMKSKRPGRFNVGQVSKLAFLPHLRVSFASNPTGNRNFEL